MAQLIPATVARHLIEGRLRADASMAQHMVMHEAVALLMGELHHAGVIDADRLVARLMQTLSAPEIAELAPGMQEQAATLAGRIRDAAHRAGEPCAGWLAGS